MTEPRPRRSDRYNFVDMKGKRVGLLKVLERAANVNGNARWRCRCKCGEIWIVEGIRLRAVLKEEQAGERLSPFSCPYCRTGRHRKERP